MRPLIVPTDTVKFSIIRNKIKSKPASRVLGMTPISMMFEHSLHFDEPKTLLKLASQPPHSIPERLNAHSSLLCSKSIDSDLMSVLQ